MTKELEFIRKTVIMACHPESKSYEEALKKELRLGCKLILSDYYLPHQGRATVYQIKEPLEIFVICADKKIKCLRKDHIGFNDCDDIKIIGQPITLARILITLKKYNEDKSFFDKDSIGVNEYGSFLYLNDCGGGGATHYTTPRFEHEEERWDLTKDLNEQRSETILSIAKLLGYKND